jgi:hypothetical protein
MIKTKFKESKHFPKHRFYHTIGSFYAPIKFNKTSVLNNDFQHRLLQKQLLKALKIHEK